MLLFDQLVEALLGAARQVGHTSCRLASTSSDGEEAELELAHSFQLYKYLLH